MSEALTHLKPAGPVADLLKARDDPKPITILSAPDKDGRQQFVVEQTCAWARAGESFGTDKLRHRIEPWLTALCQSEHLSLLVGSGITHAVHHLATGQGCPGMGQADFGDFDGVIRPAAEKAAAACGRKTANIEDQLRTANELLRGLEILAPHDEGAETKAKDLGSKCAEVLRRFAGEVLTGERGLAQASPRKREEAFNYLVSFLMSFASRSGTRDRLQLFTTNYDRYLEAGAEAAGLHLLDRFVGSLAPVFRSSRLELDLHYNPPGIRGEPRYVEGVARFTKLHGSLDWLDCDRAIRRVPLPFGANTFEQYLQCANGERAPTTNLMIYPNAAKDRETASYPYVDLFRDLAAALCRPNHTLVSFGYSFGDEHINRVIEDMLTIPSTHLVIISRSDTMGRIAGTCDRVGRAAQITLLVGSHVGDFRTLVDNYLPKPSIDRTTFRMAELLKARWGATTEGDETPADRKPEVEGGAS